MPTFQLGKELRKSIVGKEVFEIGERYRNLKPIGDGSYGFVVSAIDTLAPLEHQNVAIKKIADVFCDIVDAKRVLREVRAFVLRLLCSCSCCNSCSYNRNKGSL